MLKVGYSIENIINGLKYIENEINIETPVWETFCRRIDTIDNNVDKLIDLLREGLDLPEVSLVCILDADKEGYLRSETSLIQTAGRAARHLNGEVVLFADRETKSIQALIHETERRRARQQAYNREHSLVPRSVVRGVQESLQTIVRAARGVESRVIGSEAQADAQEVLRELEREMWEASEKLEYERAVVS